MDGLVLYDHTLLVRGKTSPIVRNEDLQIVLSTFCLYRYPRSGPRVAYRIVQQYPQYELSLTDGQDVPYPLCEGVFESDVLCGISMDELTLYGVYDVFEITHPIILFVDVRKPRYREQLIDFIDDFGDLQIAMIDFLKHLRLLPNECPNLSNKA